MNRELKNLESKSTMRISRIHIQNFRKLKNSVLDLGKEKTILVGANNSGKTSCIQAIVRFLKDNKSFSTRDFTLSNWQFINKIAEKWISDEESKPSLNDIIEYLPQMDIWIEVENKEAYLVKDLIPSLEWEGKTVGVRIVFAPKDVEALYANFKAAYTNAKTLKEEKADLEIYPKDLWDYLNRGKLSSEFLLRYYILDIKKEPEDSIFGHFNIYIWGQDSLSKEWIKLECPAVVSNSTFKKIAIAAFPILAKR